MQIANMELILGRKLYENGQYIPIDSAEFRERLMPGFADGGSDDNDEGDAIPVG